MASSSEQTDIPIFCDQLKSDYQQLIEGHKNSETELNSLKKSTEEWSEHNTQTYGLSYRLNLELHKEAEIGSRLNSLFEDAISKLPETSQKEYKNKAELISEVSSDDIVERIKNIKDGSVSRVNYKE
eukprot:gb/GECH01014752.1/.p1 GENE.gb/GECH01014752.1/~~gb/GECH01014752.1/.p1  ORF type:complete len:127 (+),score=32.28 gb/GECH01014752.1/:1-381(+)